MQYTNDHLWLEPKHRMKFKFAAILLTILLYQDNDLYRVVNDDSHAISKQLNKELKRGDVVSPGDSISFLKANSMLRLTSRAGTGAISQSGTVIAKDPESRHWLSLENGVDATRPTAIRTGRGSSINSSLMLTNYLKTMASQPAPLLIIDSLTLEVSGTYYNRRSQETISVQYRYQGKQVRKNLKWKEQGHTRYLLLDHILFPQTTAPVPVTFYKTTAGSSPVLMAENRIVLCSSAEIIPELKTINATMSKNDVVEAEILHDALYNYLSAYFGMPDTDDFFHHILPLVKQ